MSLNTGLRPVSNSIGTNEHEPTSSPLFQHVWIERSNMTSGQALSHLIVEISRDGVTSYFCGWKGCTHPVGFAKQTHLLTHIRSVHLQEKPFLCTTWFVRILPWSWATFHLYVAMPCLNVNKMPFDMFRP